VPKEQGHAARSEVSKYRQAEEWGDRENRDREQEEQFRWREEDRHGRRAKERQGDRRPNGPGRHLAGGEAVLLHAEGNAACFHADDEDRDEPDDGHPQGRSHRPDGRQEQDQHAQIRQIRRRAEDDRRRPPEEPLKKSAGSCAGRNQPRIGAL
jgi:hypothetical protein